TPTKYSQNERHGMYDGTMLIGMALERCSAPKAARGMAKQTWVRATTFWRPRAWARSPLAANRPITSSARQAADIQKGVIEPSDDCSVSTSACGGPVREKTMWPAAR